MLSLKSSIPDPTAHVLGVLVLAASACLGLAACTSTPGARPAATQSAIPSPSAQNVDPDTVLLQAETALQRKQYRLAAELYTRAASLSEEETQFAEAAKVAYDFKQMTLVSQVAARWLSINPTSEAGTRFAAFAALDQYHIDEAVTHFDALLNSAYINVAAGFLGLAPQIAENGSAPAATTVLKALVDKYPKVAEGHNALAEAALRSENFALALASAQRARELSPYWTPAGLMLARVQLVVGKIDEGLATAKSVVDQDSTAANQMEYALLLLAAGHDEDAMSRMEALAGTSNETAAVVERLKGIRDFEAGRFDAARGRFEKLIQQGAFVSESLFFLGGLAEQRQAWEEARRAYSRVINGNYAVQAQTRVARILRDHSSLDAGLSWLTDVGEQRPQYAIDMIVARSRMLEESGDAAGARVLLDSSLGDYPDAHEILIARSYLLERAGDLKGALADLEHLNSTRTRDPMVQNALGYLMVDRTRRYKEGLALIQQAHEQTPDSGPVLDSLGWALHRVGRDAEALPQLEKARERIYDPDIELHIADVYWALGRKDDARAVWKQGSERHPDRPDFAERLQRNSR
ncbi:MAG: tetratricopeptide repeat protein [Steroidobacteraceae bacterium]